MQIIEKNENSVVLEFSIPGSSDYFDGHFPGYPILPAVAQIDLIMRCASQHLGTGMGISEIKRIKFTNLILPNVPLLLKLEKNNKSTPPWYGFAFD